MDSTEVSKIDRQVWCFGLVGQGRQKSQIHVYEGAPDAFHADYRPTYRKEPAEGGWKRMLAWLRANGV